MTDTKHPWLRDPLEDMLGYQLRRASIATFMPLSDAFEALGLRATDAIIIRFVEANPGCNQAEISRSLGVKRTNMVPIVSGLVDAGLIDRMVADGRTHALYLTDKGAEMHRRIAAVTLENDRYFFGDLDEATRATLLRVLLEIRAKAGG